jgi:hypothetical protein
MEQIKTSLTEDEIIDCLNIYEEVTGRYVLPHSDSQDLWVQSFSEAKKYFNSLDYDNSI